MRNPGLQGCMGRAVLPLLCSPLVSELKMFSVPGPCFILLCSPSFMLCDFTTTMVFFLIWYLMCVPRKNIGVSGEIRTVSKIIFVVNKGNKGKSPGTQLCSTLCNPISGDLLTQGSNLHLLHLLDWQVVSLTLWHLRSSYNIWIYISIYWMDNMY